jgi:hypothetical protein
MPTSIVSTQDGPRITVSMMLKSPTLIPKRILSMLDAKFLVDAVLRNAEDAPSGSVLYFESTPLFANDNPTILDEFGEIPVTSGSLGTPKVSRVVRRAFGLRVSKTMIDRNSTDMVNVQVTQIRNTMIRAWEDAFFSAVIANAGVQVITTDKSWQASDSHIRQDVNSAKFLIRAAASDAGGQQRFGYEADTLVISDVTEADFLNSNEVSTPYTGNIADENLKYTGKLPNKFLGLDVLVSWRMSAYFASGAMVLQRKVFGGISDERPLQATPMYGEGGGPNGGPTESFRTDCTRASAIFLDQPKAVVLIAGVNGGTQSVTVGGRTFNLVAGTTTTQPAPGNVVK